MGAGLVLDAVGLLHRVLRGLSAPVRKAYTPVNFMYAAGIVYWKVVAKLGGPWKACQCPMNLVL